MGSPELISDPAGLEICLEEATQVRGYLEKATLALTPAAAWEPTSVTRPCANLLGELTRPTAVGEATFEVRTSPPGQECKPTQLTRRASSGDPPGGDRRTHQQKCQPTLQ